MLQPSAAQGWLGSQGASSGLIVKKTIRVDIPVDKFPTVCANIYLDIYFCSCSLSSLCI